MPKTRNSHGVAQPLVALEGSQRQPPAEAHEVGIVPHQQSFEVTIRVRRRAELPAVSAEGEMEVMSRQEYEARHGASSEDLQKVEEYAESCGLKVEHASSARRSVIVSGTAAAYTKAFNVTLKNYKKGDSIFRGRTGPVSIPKDLEGIITGVFGLSDEPFAHPHFRSETMTAHATASVPRGFTPVEIAQRYNFPSNLNGSGQTIGIIELGGGFRQSELDTYFHQLGLNPAKVKVANFQGGGTNNPGTDPLDPANPDVEVMLDIQVAAAVAPGAQIVVYFAPDASDKSFLDVMTAAVHDTQNNPSVISISWGGPESKATNQFQKNFDQVLQAAAALQVSVCVASGDNASADFPLNDPQRPWDGHAHVDFPASSPFALACGGTRLLGQGGSAKEVVWHPGPNEGTGGGVSRVFPLPDYQASAGVPHAKNPAAPARRGVPDVCGDAAQESGYRILCDGLFFPDPNHNPPLPPIGGTSAVAPLWAGLLALINQGLGRNVGFVNPMLYQLPHSSGALRDITSGNNGDYQSGPGWDPCTGLGAPDGRKLLMALQTLPHHTMVRSQAGATGAVSQEEQHLTGRALLAQYLRTTEKMIELAGAEILSEPASEPVPLVVPIPEEMCPPAPSIEPQDATKSEPETTTESSHPRRQRVPSAGLVRRPIEAN